MRRLEARLACYLVGHLPELVEVNRRDRVTSWDCARECGWTIRRREPAKLSLTPTASWMAGQAPALSVLLVPVGLVAIIVAMLVLGLTAPTGSAR